MLAQARSPDLAAIEQCILHEVLRVGLGMRSSFGQIL